jgi:hypothetical protein
MEPEPLRPRSHLFTVRLWLEPLGDGQSEWRGKVQHVPSGEAQYFREWSSLVIFLERELSESGWVEEPLTGSA